LAPHVNMPVFPSLSMPAIKVAPEALNAGTQAVKAATVGKQAEVMPKQATQPMLPPTFETKPGFGVKKLISPLEFSQFSQVAAFEQMSALMMAVSPQQCEHVHKLLC